jgi:uncharacterized protein
MIYVDTSVVLAQLLAEDRRPPQSLWDEDLVTSRLLQYEVWNRLHARALAGSHGDGARTLLARMPFIELSPQVLARAMEPFPTRVRTLDALHLASVTFLRDRGYPVALASFDARMCDAAMAMSLDLFEL